MAEDPSPLAEDPSPQKLCSRLFGRDPAADTVPSCPSSLAVPAGRRPWQSRLSVVLGSPRLSVVLGSPGCPSPLTVRGVRGRPGRPPRLAASPTTAATRPSIPPGGLANHSCALAARQHRPAASLLRYPNIGVDKYLSPVSGRKTTMFLPAFSGL